MATYILDYSKANDDGVGTSEGTAWKNWEVALSRLEAGDTLQCRGVTDNLVIRNTVYTTMDTGTSGSHITIENYQNETAIFKYPPGDSGETSNGNYGFFQTPAAGIHYIDFVANAQGRLKFDGEGLASASGDHQGGFYMANNNSHITFTNVEIANTNASGVNGGQSTDCQFINCLIHNCGLWPWDPVQYHDYGIYASGNNLLIDGCSIYNCSGWAWHGYPSGGTGIIIRNNKIWRNGYRDGVTGSNSNRGGLVVSGPSSVQIYNNWIYENRSNGIDLFTCNNAQVYHNACISNGGSASGASSAAGYGISCGITGTPTNAKIKNNLIVGNRVGSIRLAAGTGYDIQWNVMQSAQNGSPGSSTIANNITNAVLADEVTDYDNADYTLRDYHLKTGADSIDYCQVSVGIAFDQEGNSVAGAYRDAGANEFGADPPDAPSVSHDPTYTVTTEYGDISITVTKGTNNVVEATISGTGKSGICVDNTNVTVVRN